MRIGLLTGGGDCPGLNAVLRAVTKRLVLGHGAEVVGFEDGFLGLIERRARPLTYRDVSGIIALGGTLLGTSNRADPFAFYGAGGADVSDGVMAYCADLGLDALITIGGDGTMQIADGLARKGLRVVGVPKTIDNDLAGTDRTFGFDTAVAIAAEALDRLHTTAQSHHRVMLVETMGRYAGWIALHAGLATGADVILLPEFPYSLDEVVRVCREREAGGQRFTLVAMSEGARPEGGGLSVQKRVEGSPDPIRLGGVCQQLAAVLEDHLQSEVRATILGHVQRGGPPTPYDRVLSTRFGVAAADLAAEAATGGRSGRMVALKGDALTAVPLAEVAGKQRLVAPDDPLVRAALGVGTSFGVPNLS